MNSFFSVTVVLAGMLPAACSGNGTWARPDLVAKVENCEIDRANVSWWGKDPEDSTRFLQAAINSKARTVVLDPGLKIWNTLPLKGRSALTLVVPEGVELKAKRGAFHHRNDCLVKFDRCENVTLTGGGRISMWFEDYTNKNKYAWSEWRHAVALLGCRNVLIEKLYICDSGGDGVYVGEQNPVSACEDVIIRDVVFSRNNRQGISVISAERLTVERCVMENTCGTPPMSGIDFEPNGGLDRLRDITVRDCIVRGNRGCGFEFAIGNLNAMSPEVSIRLENCLSQGNSKPVGFYHHKVHTLSAVRGKIEFVNSVFDDADRSWTAFRASDGPETVTVAFENCKAADAKRTGVFSHVGPDCGWEAVDPPVWPDGSAIIHGTIDDLDSRKVSLFDEKPGEVVDLLELHARGTKEYLVYASKTGTVRISAKVRKVGNSSFGGCPAEVYSLKGRTIARFKGPASFGEESPYDFIAPEEGFYRLIVRPARGNVCLLTRADCPVAAFISRSRGLPGGNGMPSEICVRVGEGSKRMAVAFTGGGGDELVHARIFDPFGKCVFDRDNVGITALWFSPGTPAPGVWRLSASKASRGCFDDYTFAVFGMPGHLFLSPGKTWSLE